MTPIDKIKAEAREEAKEAWLEAHHRTSDGMSEAAFVGTVNKYIDLTAAATRERDIEKELTEIIISRQEMHDGYNGGHHEVETREAFHHGMDTVFNWLESLALTNKSNLDCTHANITWGSSTQGVCDKCGEYVLTNKSKT